MVQYFDNLYYPQEVANRYGDDANIYVADDLFLTDQICEAQEQLRLTKIHKAELPDANKRISDLNRDFGMLLGRLRNASCVDGAKVFSPIKYLDSVCVPVGKHLADIVQEYIDPLTHSNYEYSLCFPQKLKRLLIPVFKHYHVYKFYERNISVLRNGEVRFLMSLPKLKAVMSPNKILDHFYWDQNDITFLEQFYKAVIQLKAGERNWRSDISIK